MMTFLKQFYSDRDGQDMVEYGLVVALIAMVVLTAIATFGTNLSTGLGLVNGKITANVK